MKRDIFYLLAVSSVLFTACTKTTPSQMSAQSTPTPITVVSPDVATPVVLSSSTPLSSPKSTAKLVTPKPQSPSLSVTQLPSTWKSDDTRSLSTVDTIVIHTLYNPKFPSDLTITHAKEVLDESQVSSHYVIARDGKVYQLVPENYQAWQAGVSQMPAPDNRTGVNAFSIGIEMIATETSGITQAQYDSLTSLVVDVSTRLPIKYILGHSDIAPGRKTDPWNFDWTKFASELQAKSSSPPTILHH